MTPVRHFDKYKNAQFSKILATWKWVTTGLAPRGRKKSAKNQHVLT
jgi:hypothetical protein